MSKWRRQLLERARPVVASRTARALGAAAAVVLLALLIGRLALLVRAGALEGFSVRPEAVGAALLAMLAGNLFLAEAWRASIAVFQPAAALPRTEAAAIALLSQLGKYVPGGVVQLAALFALGARFGVPARSIGIALAGGAAVLVVAALAVGLAVVIPWTPLAGAAAGLVATGLVWGGRPREWALLAGASIAVFTCYGVAVALLVAAGGFELERSAAFIVGAYALAWAAGFVVLIAPGGLGIREAAFVAIVAGEAGEAPALAVALGSRTVSMAADLLAALAAASLLRVRRRDVVRR
ncbi:MAG TPA: lysylphosphatidylglycerol synthase domain-containing protein [Gaiellaceae bacterium]|nr:lysylphosphatidylglycerol synthase domain-containing protein [Gaiellaceae bacterium]